MTQERLVSLETAKKLKELRFNELCDNCSKDCHDHIITFDLKGFHNLMPGITARPTQCHVQRWLLKKGYFVSTTFVFKEFDKNAEDCDNAKMLFIIAPEILKIKETSICNIYENSRLTESDIDNMDNYNELKSNEDVLEDAINIVLDILLKNK